MGVTGSSAGAAGRSSRPRPSTARTTVPALRRRCRDLRDRIASHFGAAELDAYAPGGAENQLTGRDGWVDYLAALRVFASRVASEGRADAPSGGGMGAEAVTLAGRERILAKALANEPVTVRLVSGRDVVVSPKSYHAAKWCQSNDAQVRYLVGAALAEVDDLAVCAYAPLLESLCVRLWAWAVTSEGPGLPFDERTAADDAEANIPDYVTTMAPEDLLALGEAWLVVQHLRPSLCASFFPPDDARSNGMASGLPISGFLGAAAQELGQQPSELLRRWTVGELFAQAVSAAQAGREARARAEADAANRGRR
jgi:hypothetical protein